MTSSATCKFYFFLFPAKDINSLFRMEICNYKKEKEKNLESID